MILKRMYSMPSWGTRNPFSEIERIRDQLDQLFGYATGGTSRTAGAGVFPLINLTEDQNNYYVRAELPGLKADELDIQVTGKSMTISGDRLIPGEDENARYHRREREAGRFSRGITLPGEINNDGVDATIVDGILTISMPKAEKAKPKQIAVN